MYKISMKFFLHRNLPGVGQYATLLRVVFVFTKLYFLYFSTLFRLKVPRSNRALIFATHPLENNEYFE